jgi:uncharacterized protein
MQITGEYTFDAPHDIVWQALQDPLVLGAVVHTCWGVEKVDENQYTGILQFKIGSMQGTFRGNINLMNVNAPTSYDIEVRGNGLLGVANVKGSMNIEPVEERTRMHYKGEAQFGGRIASVGSRLIESAVNAMLNQSLDALNKYLQVEVKKRKK